MFINIVTFILRMEFDELLITTGVDSLVRLVKEKQRVELEDASSILNIPPESLEDWARVLEEEGILRIEYRLTKIYLIWIKPTADEIAAETESFYEEKAGIQKEIEGFRGRMEKRQAEVEELQKTFTEFYDKTYTRMQKLEEKVSTLPAGELISEGTFTKGEQELAVMRSEVQQIRTSLGDIRKELEGLGIGIGESKSEQRIADLDKAKKELESMQEEMKGIRKKSAEVPSGAMPSAAEIRKKFESLNKEFSSLKARNARLREDMISLHESSQILQDVAESIMGQEEKIKGIHKEVAAVTKEAEKLLKKSEDVAKKAKHDMELVERLGDSVTVAKGIVKRFPSQKKVIAELEELKESEDKLAQKYQSMKKLIGMVGGKQVSAKEFAELTKEMDDKVEQMRRDLDSLEATLEDEKSTYLTFQRIKERVVPSIQSYGTKLDTMEKQIRKIEDDTVAQKASLRKEAEEFRKAMKGGEMKDILKVAAEVRSKKKMLDEIKTSMDDLVTLSDNLNKRVTLLSREARLLEIRAGGEARLPPAEEERRKEIRNKLELSKDEEMEFRRKREELKKLIKRLWEE